MPEYISNNGNWVGKRKVKAEEPKVEPKEEVKPSPEPAPQPAAVDTPDAPQAS